MTDNAHALADLATQYWKLCESFAAQIAASADGGAHRPADEATLRYARSRLETILARAGMTMRVYTGQPWDGTLPPLAINAEELGNANPAQVRVGRTLEPTLLMNGGVMLAGTVMLENA